MSRASTRGPLLLGAIAVLAVAITPFAVAVGDESPGGPPAKPAGVAKKLKKLSKKVKRLQVQVATLEAERGASRPPSGPAGGDLAGTFPNPGIASNAIGTSELQDESVTAPAIAPAAVGTAALQDNSVTGSQVGSDAIRSGEIAADAVGQEELPAYTVVQEVVSIGSGGGVGSAEANCPAATQLVTGGAFFAFPSGDLSASAVDAEAAGWYGEGQNNGGVAQNLTVRAYCLPSGSP